MRSVEIGAQMMAISVLHKCPRAVTLAAGSAKLYGCDHGFEAILAVVDGDECVMFLRNGDWVATAQAFAL